MPALGRLVLVALVACAPAGVGAARPRSLSRAGSGAAASLSALAAGSTPPPPPAPALTLPPCRTLVGVAAGCLGALQFGYSLGVVNAPQEVISRAIGITDTPTRWAAIVSVFGPAGLVGANGAGALVSEHGARAVMVCTAFGFLAGGALMWLAGGASYSAQAAFWLLVAGRVCVGVAAGIATVAVPVYLGESAPVHLRGAFGNLNQMGVVVGILLSQLLGAALSTPRGWRVLMGAPALLGLLQLLSAPLLLPSPAHLLQSGQRARALEALERMRPRGTSASTLASELSALASSVADAPARGRNRRRSAQPAASASALVAARSSRAVRRALGLGVLLMLAQQFSGINAVFFYSTAIFRAAGLSSPIVGTLVTGVVNVVSTALGVGLVEVCGRRPLLLVGMAGMAVCALALTGLLAAGAAAPAWLCLLTVCASVTFFEIGLGSIPWQIGNEIFEPSCRASAMALCAAVNWLATSVVGFAFPLLQRSLGQLCFVPFAACLAVAFALTQRFLPETKARTIGEIQEALGAAD